MLGSPARTSFSCTSNGMTPVPSFLAISLVGPIVGIGCHLLPLPEVFPGTLTTLLAAIALVLDSMIEAEQTPTMGTSDLLVHGFPPAEATNLTKTC